MITFPANPVVDQLHTAENNVVYKFDGVAWNTVAAIGSGVWGAVTGTLADQADLTSALAGKSSTGHNHSGIYSPVGHGHDISNVTGLQDELNSKTTSVFGATGVITAVDHVKMNLVAGNPTPEVGRMFWDDANGTLAIPLKGGNVTLQVGQESHIRVENNTGSTILDGAVVYVSGGAVGAPHISKAQANDPTSVDSVIGLTTEDIPTGQLGFVTVFGFVNNVNTSAFTDGDILWLSPTVSGGLTNVRPAHPNHAVRIGFCVNAATLTGRILVYPQKYANANDIELPMVGTPEDVIDVLDWFSHSWSTGLTDGGALTPNGVAGTVDIAPSDFVTRLGTLEDAQLAVYRDPGVTGLALAANDVSYIYRDYNAGSPIWSSTTSITGFNGIDKVIAYVVARNGTTMNVIDLRRINVDFGRKMRRKDVEFDGYVYKGWWRSSVAQSVLSASGRNPLVGIGRYYYFGNPIEHAAFDTTIAGAGILNNFIYFRNRASWVQDVDQKLINNTQYDNAGVLTTMTNGRWRTDWVYVVLCSSSPYLAVVMGNTQHNSITDAQGESQPTVPPHFDGAAVLIGQIVIEKNAATMTASNSAGSSFGLSAQHTHVAANISDFNSAVDARLPRTSIAATYTPSGSTTLAYQRGSIYHATAVTGPTTWVITGLPASGTIGEWSVELTNGLSQTQTWFSGIKWDKGVAPTLTAGVDILTFYTRDGGTTIRGFMAAEDSK